MADINTIHDGKTLAETIEAAGVEMGKMYEVAADWSASGYAGQTERRVTRFSIRRSKTGSGDNIFVDSDSYIEPKTDEGRPYLSNPATGSSWDNAARSIAYYAAKVASGEAWAARKTWN
jgi:hypothetical protein